MEYRDPNCAYCVHGDPLAVFEDPKEERTKQFLRVFEQ